MMKKDPYKHKERWFSWKEKAKTRIPDISKPNSDLILQYLEDMELGVNVSLSNIKGSRSYTRLNTLKEKMCFLSKKFQELYNIDDLTKVDEKQVCKFFSDMRNGTIKRGDGKRYIAVADSVKIFKAFWHWWIKINSKKGKEIRDITTDLDTRQEKPKWVYLTENQIKQLCDNAKYDYKIIMMFLYDSGIRAPSELINIKVSDLYNNCKELQIRDEISKTFGRKIKLMLSSELVKEYIKKNELKKEDYLFSLNHKVINRYIKRLATKVLGEGKSEAGQKYSELTMYDFRHCSCCYWLPRYKSESALKYRFGWKGSDKIHYYSELLGMKDTISEEDLLIDVTKTEIENRLTKSENEKTMLQERVQLLEGQMKEILGLVEKAKSNLGKNNFIVA